MTASEACPLPALRGREERESGILSFIARYSLAAELAPIPWDKLPADLRKACEEYLSDWWDSLDPDEPIVPSGLLDMTVAQLLAVWIAQLGGRPRSTEAPGLFQRRFRVVSYLRVEPEESVPMSFAEALSELDQLQLLAPESVHRLEEVCQVIVANDAPPTPSFRPADSAGEGSR